jgi:hypothetical protein
MGAADDEVNRSLIGRQLRPLSQHQDQSEHRKGIRITNH